MKTTKTAGTATVEGNPGTFMDGDLFVMPSRVETVTHLVLVGISVPRGATKGLRKGPHRETFIVPACSDSDEEAVGWRVANWSKASERSASRKALAAWMTSQPRPRRISVSLTVPQWNTAKAIAEGIGVHVEEWILSGIGYAMKLREA